MNKYYVRAVLVLSCILVSACQRSPSEVVDKVLIDFGVREKPEGYVSPSDQVFERLRAVGQSEMARMNQAARHGEIKTQDEGGLQAKYYKEVKVYESFHPLDANAVTRGTDSERGYLGYIEYSYTIYQSPRKATRTEAAAEDATIRTDTTGRDTYRYKFGPGGTWDGGKGELTTR